MGEEKLRRGMMVLEISVPDDWAGSEAEGALIQRIEAVFGLDGSGSGPGGVRLDSMFNRSYVPGQDADMDAAVEKMRREYPAVGGPGVETRVVLRLPFGGPATGPALEEQG